MLRHFTLFTVFLLSRSMLTCSVYAEHPVAFTVKTLAVDANEGCAVADFDQDGKLDVVAGRQWYQNGDWLPRPVRSIEDVNGYIHSNGDFVHDVNGDGWPDVVAGGFFQTDINWYENPGQEKLMQGFQWTKHLLVDTGLSQNEWSMLHDFDGDGTPEWVSDSWNPKNPLVLWSFANEEREVEVKQGNKSEKQQQQVPVLKRHLICETGQGHGFGVGDINNDGRNDIITGTGWHAGPESNPLEDEWVYHSDWDAHMSCPVMIRDINSNGKNDIIWGNPHDFGLIVWFAQEPAADGKLLFKEEFVDKSFSQLHCVHFVDLDGDGQEELLTGKRVRAHNGGDPGGTEPPQVCYYTIDPKTHAFTKHIIEEGHVGIGLQIRTADIDADGDTDIVLAGKEGTQILFNQIIQSEK